jgi:hypothetical protein
MLNFRHKSELICRVLKILLTRLPRLRKKVLCVNEEIVRADSFQNLGSETGSPLNRLLADPIKRNKEVAEVFPSENPAMISVSQFLARDSNLTQ